MTYNGPPTVDMHTAFKKGTIHVICGNPHVPKDLGPHWMGTLHWDRRKSNLYVQVSKHARVYAPNVVTCRSCGFRNRFVVTHDDHRIKAQQMTDHPA